MVLHFCQGELFKPFGGWILCSLVAFGAVSLRRFKASRSSASLPIPPGPAASWSSGRALHAPLSFEEVESLVATYGPVFSIKSGSQVTIVIGTIQAAIEIMDKQSSLTADRPHSVAASEILSGGMRLLLLGPGQRLKAFRKVLQKYLSPKAIQDYEPLQTRYARSLVQDIINDPTNHISHAKRYAASVALSFTYGKTTPTSVEDPELQKVFRTLRRLGAATRIRSFWLENFPFIRHIPFLFRELKSWHKDEVEFYKEELETSRERPGPSLGKYLLEDSALGFEEKAYLAGTMYSGSSDTTSGAISIALMAAACFPEEQAKVQAELDDVVGQSHAPTFNDQDSLPRVMAFVLESYRWRPVGGGGFPHRATQDFIWNRYCIPKGASIVGNHRSLSRDPSFFPNPNDFKPDRWLTEDGKLRLDAIANTVLFNFGAGRRSCPGYHLANRSLFITVSHILWAFGISQDSEAMIDTSAFNEGVSISPKPFKVVFKPRIDSLAEKLSSSSLP